MDSYLNCTVNLTTFSRLVLENRSGDVCGTYRWNEVCIRLLSGTNQGWWFAHKEQTLVMGLEIVKECV